MKMITSNALLRTGCPRNVRRRRLKTLYKRLRAVLKYSCLPAKERDRLSTLRVSIPRILVPSPITRDGYPSGRDPASRNTPRRRVFTSRELREMPRSIRT
jgi:hypothetical protein